MPGPSSGGSGPQASSSTAVVANVGPKHRMPKPGERNAPIFEVDKPEELGRFFDRIEDWFVDVEIDDDDEKKRRIVKYLDADSEVQWKALTTFTTGTYEEFKTQVMSSYPAAEEVMKGSVTALKRKIKKIGPVHPDDRDELLSLIRIMTAEIMKLKKIVPPIHTNRELVELFLSRLDHEFASRVANKLSVHRLINANIPVGQGGVARNPEDMFDIEEVMDMAKQTSLEQANPFGKFLAVSVDKTSPETVKLEEAVARLTDSINVQLQHSKAVDQRLQTMQNFINQPRVNFTEQRPSVRPYGQRESTGTGMDCFYCNGPHRIGECDQVIMHIEAGLLKKIDGRLRLADGSRMPREDGKTTRDLVEATRSRPGIIPMSKIQDQASLYQRAPMANYVQSRVEEDSDRVVQEFIQRIGVDRARQCLQKQEQYLEDAAEWEQNFC